MEDDVELVVMVDEMEVLVVVVELEACLFAKARTLDANGLFSRSRNSIACLFEVNTPSLKCGNTACSA